MHAPLDNTYRAEWCDLTTLAAVADEWRALAARAAEPNVFYEPSFALAAAPVFGARAGAVVVRSALGRLAGLFPARIERPQGGIVRMLTGWTHPFAPLGVPLVDRDDAQAVIAAWLQHLAENAAMLPFMLMPFLPEHGPFAAALDAVLSRGGYASASFGGHQRALLAPGVSRTGYIERALSAGRRKELRRQRRRLEESGPVIVHATSSPDEIADALDDFFALEASGWKGMAGTAIADDPEIKRFVQSAVAGLVAEGRARIDRMLLDGRAIAATVTLQSGGTAWCWKIAYSEEFARFSPGVQLVCELTERLTSDPDIGRTDSCATADHPMIDAIWRERLSLSDRLIAIKPSVVPFAVASGVEQMRRAAIAAAKNMRNRLRGR